MSTDQGRFFHFRFTPTRLSEERRKIERAFNNQELEMAHHIGQYQLPRIMEQIRKLKPEMVHEYAVSMRKMEVMILMFGWPFTDETHETRVHINAILLQRYTLMIGRTAWALLQQRTDDVYLEQLLRGVHRVNRLSFLELDESMQKLLDQEISAAKEFIEGIVNMLSRTSKKTTAALKQLKVKVDSPLEEVLLKRVLKEVLRSDQLIQRDGVDYVVDRLERYAMNDYKELLHSYLIPREHEDFHHSILSQAINRLHDPREREADWAFLPEAVIYQVKRWLISSELKRFFEKDTNSKRFDYWKRFLNYMEDVKLLKDPFTAFIYFDQFVVVEFGTMGAAYFYHTEGFNTVIEPMTKLSRFRTTSTSVKESMLKKTEPYSGGVPLYINKLDHRGGSWQRNFDIHMQRYLISVD